MHRGIAVFNLIQALVYGFVATELGAAWLPAGLAFGLAAAAQVGAGVGLIARVDAKWIRWASGISLGVAAFGVGLYLQVGVHLIRHFTPIGGEAAWNWIGTILLATPWLAGFPLAQLIATRPGRASGAAVGVLCLVAGVGPPAHGWAASAPTARYAEVDGVLLARWVHNRMTGGDPWLFPPGDAPVKLVVSALRDGQVLATQTVAGPNMAETLRQVGFVSRDRRTHVWVEAVVAEGPIWSPWLADRAVFWARPAESVLVVEDASVPSYVVWSADRVSRAAAAPLVRLPAARVSDLTTLAPTGWAEVRTFVADGGGPVAFPQGWRTPDPLSAESARASALAGARHLLRNMSEQGRFAYVVQYPDGRHGKGYNFPRHAGGAWFLARVAARTDDPDVRAGALRAVDYLQQASQAREGGAAFVIDPTRRDGKAWVGTTALAALAAFELGDPGGHGLAWAKHVASAVDAQGSVRGDLDIASGSWPAQDRVTYAQGQGLLALAAAVRAGHTDLRPALDRAATFVESGAYAPGPGARLLTLDEHWMCLAALAAEEVRGEPSGAWVCDAYLRQQARALPLPGAPLATPAGAAAGVAEAWVARAALAQRRGEPLQPWLEASERMGAYLLAQQYRPEDGRRLARPARLIGGFRDRPWSLDVRVDAVQHAGCAMLGVESLLMGRRLPGGLP
jgi:hypothetical protein